MLFGALQTRCQGDCQPINERKCENIMRMKWKKLHRVEEPPAEAETVTEQRLAGREQNHNDKTQLDSVESRLY